MKFAHWIVAGALAVPGLALAQAGQQQPGQQDRMGQQQGQQQRGQQQAGQQQHGAKQKRSAAMYEGKDNFEIEGTVQQVQRNRITIQRQELPPVQLQLAEGAKVMVDGQEAQLQQIRPGQEVRATFNIADDQALAIEIEAQGGQQQQRQQPGQQQPGQQQPGQQR
jgi:hypothetical protein